MELIQHFVYPILVGTIWGFLIAQVIIAIVIKLIGE